MTLPLQDIKTAPRDGSDVLLVLIPKLAEPRGSDKVLARWCPHNLSWRGINWSYPDDDFSGWLDIEALALDSARLDFLERYRKPGELRSVIDKEMNRG